MFIMIYLNLSEILFYFIADLQSLAKLSKLIKKLRNKKWHIIFFANFKTYFTIFEDLQYFLSQKIAFNMQKF